MWVCRDCKKENRGEDIFCTRCGARRTLEEQEPGSTVGYPEEREGQKKGTVRIPVLLSLLVLLSLGLLWTLQTYRGDRLIGAAAAPFSEYGNFTDVSDDEQLRQRAEWFYETYLLDPEKAPETAKGFSVERLMDDLRIFNGGLPSETYDRYNSAFYLVAAARDLHTIANNDSLAQYGTQLFFTPTAPLFLDGSAAQRDAILLDRCMESVVDAIRAEDDAAFLTAAADWGKRVDGIFNGKDAGDGGSLIRDIPAPMSFVLYHAMYSKYASTILEYSETRNLTRELLTESDGQPLPQMLFDLDEHPLADSAIDDEVFAFYKSQYQDKNPSLPEYLLMEATKYYRLLTDSDIVV